MSSLLPESGAWLPKTFGAVLDLLLERLDRLAPVLVAHVVVEQLERLDLVVDELPHPIELGLELWFDGEIDRHGDPPVLRCRTAARAVPTLHLGGDLASQ